MKDFTFDNKKKNPEDKIGDIEYMSRGDDYRK